MNNSPAVPDKKMRILYLSFIELDTPNACRTHTVGIIKGFAGHGCHVDALIPRPLKKLPPIPNVRIFYIWPWSFSRTGRLSFKLLSTLVMFFLCLRSAFDAIYVREMEANPGPRLCSKLFKILLYIEINELILPILLEKGIGAFLINRIKKQQESDFKQSSGLIIPSIPMCNWIIDRYRISENKIHMIINGANITEAKKVSFLKARSKLSLSPECFCLGFVGNIYERYDFITIMKAMVECQNQIPDLYLVVIGEGPLVSKVRATVKKLGLENRTIFTGYIQSDELGEVLPAFDVGLSCLTKKNALRYGPITTKVSTYALNEIAVICAGSSLKGYPIEIVQGVHLVPAEDPYSLADKIRWLYNYPEERKHKAKMLREFAVKKLTWDATAEEILRIIRKDINLRLVNP